MLSFGTNEGRCGHWLHPCDTPLNAEVTIKGQTCWLQCLQFLGVFVVFDGEFRIATLCGDDFWIGDSTGEKPIDVTTRGFRLCGGCWHCVSIKRGKVRQHSNDWRCRTHLPARAVMRQAIAAAWRWKKFGLLQLPAGATVKPSNWIQSEVCWREETDDFFGHV